ncbi:MAG TPA: AlkA N-terminal domain-containing protein [Holophagaceae bacterium]|nr:AlkA N-terminal domain-containing protein [Holophagaceae bacterium]
MRDALREPQVFHAVADFAKAMGMTLRKAETLFLRHAQRTPEGFLEGARVAAACRRMAEGGESSDAALAAGFKRRTGLSPDDYATMLEGRGFALRLPSGYRVEDLLSYQGRDAQSVSERVEDRTLRKAFLLEGQAAVLQLRFTASSVEVTLDPPTPPGPNAMLQVHRMARRLLGLDQDPAALEAEPSHARLVAGRKGLRVPLSLDPFEALMWAILGQQVNLAFAYALRRDIIRAWGVPASAGLIAHPSPEVLAALEPEDLLPLRLSRRKAEYLVLASRRVADGTLDLDGFLTATSAERSLLALRGCGPWTAAYTLMRGLGFPDCVPVGDAGLTLALQRFFSLASRPGPKETLELMAAFAPHRSLATYHLWTSLKGVPA